MINNLLMYAIWGVTVLIILALVSDLDYLKRQLQTDFEQSSFTINDLTRKLAEAYDEIDKLKENGVSYTSFLYQYNKLEEYLHKFGAKYEAYYGVPSFADVTEYSYIINIYDKDGAMLFEIVLPDVTKTNPEGLLTCYNVKENSAGKELNFKNICKLINKKIFLKI